MKIMFVCHGNICRSPMAEFIMKKLLAEAGLSDKISVFSAATSSEEICCDIGNPMYPPAVRELSKNGIPFTERRAVQLKEQDAEAYDLFVGMDSANFRNMNRILGASASGKIKKLMDFTPRGGDVADPWYTDRFDIAYKDILEGCRGLLKELKTKL